MTRTPKYYGGIEAGGTKFNCTIATATAEIVAETRIATTTPQETLTATIAFFRENQTRYPIQAMGIGAFGPVDLNPASATYGYITSTPKPGWAQTDICGEVKQALNIPVAFDTDVNSAALGEYRWGAAQELDTFIYLTVGTGIGGGAMVNHKLLHGLVHPEMGHIPIPHDWARDPFKGVCPYHGDCLEGLATGPAIEARWGVRAEHLPQDHPAWALEAHYLALAMHAYICTLSPQRIIVGGGVASQLHILPMVRAETIKLLNGYVRAVEIEQTIDTFIVAPKLGGRAGVLGAIALALEAR
jgi:fructokinase